MSKRFLAVAAGVVGVAFVGLAVYYWMTPSGSLPAWLPGFEAGSAHIHLKHGIASLLLGLASFAYAWFGTGKKKPPAGSYDKSTNDTTPTATQ